MCNDQRFLIQNPGRLPDPGFFQSGILLFCGSIFFTVILRFSYCSGPLKLVSSSPKHYAFSWCSIGWSHILPQNPPHFSTSAIKDTFCLPSYFLNSFFYLIQTVLSEFSLPIIMLQQFWASSNQMLLRQQQSNHFFVAQYLFLFHFYGKPSLSFLL